MKHDAERKRYAEIAKKNGRTIAIFNVLVDRRGWSYEDAALKEFTPLKMSDLTKEQKYQLRNCGLNPKTVINRLAYGWSFEQAISEDTRPFNSDEATYEESKLTNQKDIDARIKRQIQFYHSNGLTIPKKYHQYIEEHKNYYSVLFSMTH